MHSLASSTRNDITKLGNFTTFGTCDEKPDGDPINSAFLLTYSVIDHDLMEALLAIPLTAAALITLTACNSTGTASGAASAAASAGAAPVVLAEDRFSPSFIHAHLKIRRTTVDQVLALYGPPASRDNVASPSGDRSIMTYIRPETVSAGVGNTLGAIASLPPPGSCAGEAL